MIMIDDVSLWSKLESTWYVYSILLILDEQHSRCQRLNGRRKSGSFSAGGGRHTAATPAHSPAMTTGLKRREHSVEIEAVLGFAGFGGFLTDPFN